MGGLQNEGMGILVRVVEDAAIINTSKWKKLGQTRIFMVKKRS